MPVNKKLYPPNIEGTIPAFYGTTLVVPFSMNKAVSKIEVEGMAIKIKTIQKREDSYGVYFSIRYWNSICWNGGD